MKRSTSRARSRPPKLQWVEQVDKGGCSLACLAMLLSTTYARMRELAPTICGTCGITDDTILFQVLADHGYAVQPVWLFREHTDDIRPLWPPKPWAPTHLCSVTQMAKDVYGHYVVMDGKGVVFDPALPGFEPRALADYHEVEWVAGVWKVGDTS